MKASIILAFCVVACLQLCQALPQTASRHRIRREAEKSGGWSFRDSELYKEALKEKGSMQKGELRSYKILLEKLVDQAKKADLKSDDLTAKIEEYEEFLNQINEVADNELKNEESIKKLVDLNSDISDAVDFELTKEQKLIQRILDDNGIEDHQFEYFKHFINYHNHLEERVAEHIAKLTDAEKQEQAELIEWLEQSKKAKGLDNYYNITWDFFDLFEDKTN